MTGNGPSELRKLLRQMQDLSQGKALAPVTRAVAHESIVRIKDCFRRGETPYGDKWAPVARGGMPLLDTGRLRNGFVDNSRPGRVEIHNPTKYAALHNFGGKVSGGLRRGWMFVRARQFLPDSRGLPASWEEKLSLVANLAFYKFLGFKRVDAK